MLQFDSTPARPIPTGILVSGPEQPCKAERPTPRRKLSAPTRPIPWLWIVTGGSVAWMGVLVMIALYSMGHERAQPPMDRPIAAKQPAFVQAADVFPQAPEILIEPEPMPVPMPKLAPREPKFAQNDEAPPPLEILPDVSKPEPLVEPKRPAKDIDFTIYANCKRIGTDVLFMKEPPEAFQRAWAEKKLVFMMHLSGNLEDPGFT